MTIAEPVRQMLAADSSSAGLGIKVLSAADGRRGAPA